MNSPLVMRALHQIASGGVPPLGMDRRSNAAPVVRRVTLSGIPFGMVVRLPQTPSYDPLRVRVGFRFVSAATGRSTVASTTLANFLTKGNQEMAMHILNGSDFTVIVPDSKWLTCPLRVPVIVAKKREANA